MGEACCVGWFVVVDRGDGLKLGTPDVCSGRTVRTPRVGSSAPVQSGIAVVCV